MCHKSAARLADGQFWRSSLGRVHFSIYINVLDIEIKCVQNGFVDDNMLEVAVDSRESREALQKDCDKLKDLAITNHTKFNKSKFLILGQSNPRTIPCPSGN